MEKQIGKQKPKIDEVRDKKYKDPEYIKTVLDKEFGF